MLKNELLKKIRKEKGISLAKLSELTGIPKSTLHRYENGETKKFLPNAMPTIERVLNLPTGTLYGMEHIYKKLPTPEITTDYVEFPVIGEVAAGYEHIAVEDWEGDKIKIPAEYISGRGRDNYFVLRVKGDSMYPQYQDGDKVLVLKQSTMDYSGQIGVIIYGDENATLKKVEYKYGENWLRLVPINPNHPTVKIENEELEHCRVLGVPKLLIREFKD